MRTILEVKAYHMIRKLILAGVSMGVAVILVAGVDASAKGKDKGDKHGKGDGKGDDATAVFKPEVLAKILQHNPELPTNFITHSPPDQPIKLGDGKTYPLYQLDQFLQANFRIRWYARKKEGEEIITESAFRLHRLMALPAFHDLVLHFRNEYKISGKKVSSEQAYNHFRHCGRRIGVTAGKQYKLPVGGGSGIAAPSWAVWKAMNLFEHETCHCIGIGHDSGGLSGPIAGKLRVMDRKGAWNYPTIDANTLVVTPPRDRKDKGDKKEKGGKRGKHGAGPSGQDLGDGEDTMDNDNLDAGPENDVVIFDDDAASSNEGVPAADHR